MAKPRKGSKCRRCGGQGTIVSVEGMFSETKFEVFDPQTDKIGPDTITCPECGGIGKYDPDFVTGAMLVNRYLNGEKL